MSCMRRRRGHLSESGLFILLLCLAVAVAAAIEAWTPQTGEVDLDEPSDSVQARFQHAVALIAAGEPASAAVQLRELRREHPDAEWVEQAHYLTGVALFCSSRYPHAFQEWERYLEQYPEAQEREIILAMQRQAAHRTAQENLEKGLALYDRLIESASSEEFAALCQKEKADASLEAKRYAQASERYLALIDYHPDSHWVPYAWYKYGMCRLRLAEWLARGGEYLDQAERALQGFRDSFSEHPLTPEATQQLTKVHRLQAERLKRIAQYYAGPGRSPTAALSYLRAIQQRFPETPQAAWARGEAEKTLANLRTPLRGEHIRLELPGVSLQQTEPKETSKE